MLAIRLNSKRIIASHAQKICMTTITGGAKNLLTGGVGREGGKVSSNKGKSMCHSFIILLLFLSDFLALFLSSSSSPFFFFRHANYHLLKRVSWLYVKMQMNQNCALSLMTEWWYCITKYVEIIKKWNRWFRKRRKILNIFSFYTWYNKILFFILSSSFLIWLILLASALLYPYPVNILPSISS